MRVLDAMRMGPAAGQSQSGPRDSDQQIFLRTAHQCQVTDLLYTVLIWSCRQCVPHSLLQEIHS